MAILKQSKSASVSHPPLSDSGGISIAKIKIIMALYSTSIFELPGGYCISRMKILRSYFTNIIFNNQNPVGAPFPVETDPTAFISRFTTYCW